jgi:hypothetical protein
MIGPLLVDLLSWGVGVAVAILGIYGFGRAKRREGRKETYIEALKGSAKRQEAGREAVSDLRGNSRADDLEQLRRNNAEW